MALGYPEIWKEGNQPGAGEDVSRTEETESVYQLLNNVSKRERMDAAKVLRTFLIACSDVGLKEEEAPGNGGRYQK